MNQEKIGKFISELRKNKGLTQAELAEKLMISVQSISKWECDNAMPDISQIVPLAAILGVTTDCLLGVGGDEKADREALYAEAEKNNKGIEKVYARQDDAYYACYQLYKTHIKKYPLDTCSVYISIPFCPTRCSYCSFVSFTTKKLLALIPAYLEALKVELSLIARQIKESGFKLKTVYIGGGTPTTLNEEQLEDLLAYIDELFDTSSLDEFTLEAGRPDTITEKKLQSAYDHNVTRISINPQSLNNFVLQEIDRCHTAEMFFKAYEMARKSGIPCINTDLIMGLPTDDIESYSDTLEKIIELSPENITAHTFCVKRSADILKEEGQDIFARENFEVSKCVDYTQIMTKKAGYIPYYMYRQKNAKGNLENVGYCKKGTEGIYNILMMEEIHSIFSAGAGAVTKLVGERNVKIERIFNPKYPYEYLEQDRYKVFEQTKKIMEGFFAKL